MQTICRLMCRLFGHKFPLEPQPLPPEWHGSGWCPRCGELVIVDQT